MAADSGYSLTLWIIGGALMGAAFFLLWLLCDYIFSREAARPSANAPETAEGSTCPDPSASSRSTLPGSARSGDGSSTHLSRTVPASSIDPWLLIGLGMRARLK